MPSYTTVKNTLRKLESRQSDTDRNEYCGVIYIEDHCCLINTEEKEARRALLWYNDFAKRSYKPRRSEPWPRAIPF